jgi:hypothetical protein
MKSTDEENDDQMRSGGDPSEARGRTIVPMIKAIATAAVLSGAVVINATQPAAAAGNHLTDRVAAVRAALAAKLGDASEASSTNSSLSYAEANLAQWVNWGNWGNWHDWRDWRDWNNWGNWGNAWGNWGNM